MVGHSLVLFSLLSSLLTNHYFPFPSTFSTLVTLISSSFSLLSRVEDIVEEFLVIVGHDIRFGERDCDLVVMPFHVVSSIHGLLCYFLGFFPLDRG